MAWTVELSAEVHRQLKKLDPPESRRVLKFLRDRIAKANDPRTLGKALQGPRIGEFWRYRVGDYRLICKLEDEQLVVLVLRVGHRSEVYR